MAKHRAKKMGRGAWIVGLAAVAAAGAAGVFLLTKKAAATPPPGNVGRTWHQADPTVTLQPGVYRISAPDQWPATGLNTTTAIISEFYGAQEAVLPADWGDMPGAAGDAQTAGVSGDADGRDRMEITLTAPLQLHDTNGVLLWAAQ